MEQEFDYHSRRLRQARDNSFLYSLANSQRCARANIVRGRNILFSHTDFNGGKIMLDFAENPMTPSAWAAPRRSASNTNRPDDLLVLEAIAKDWLQSEATNFRLCLQESKSEFFRVLLDLDLETEVALEPADLDMLVREIQFAMSILFRKHARADMGAAAEDDGRSSEAMSDDFDDIYGQDDEFANDIVGETERSQHADDNGDQGPSSESGAANNNDDDNDDGHGNAAPAAMVFRADPDTGVLAPVDASNLSQEQLHAAAAAAAAAASSQPPGSQPLASQRSASAAGPDAREQLWADEAQAMVVVVMRKPKRVAGSETRMKYGVHLVWPFLPIDVPTMFALRYNIKYHIEGEMANVPAFRGVNWHDVIDIAVTCTNGLRPVGMGKGYTCGACKARNPEEFCQHRRQHGRCNVDDSYYDVWRVYDTRGMQSTEIADLEIVEDRDELLRLGQGIRFDEQTGEWEYCSGIPASSAAHAHVLQHEPGPDTFVDLRELGRRFVDKNRNVPRANQPNDNSQPDDTTLWDRRARQWINKKVRLLALTLHRLPRMARIPHTPATPIKDPDWEVVSTTVTLPSGETVVKWKLRQTSTGKAKAKNYTSVALSELNAAPSTQNVLHNLLVRHMRKLHPCYSALRVERVLKRAAATPTFIIHVRGGHSCHFCLNKEGHHRSNTCYFVIKCTRRVPFMQQRCFSTKTPEGKRVACKSFFSKSVVLSSNLKAFLYPGLADVSIAPPPTPVNAQARNPHQRGARGGRRGGSAAARLASSSIVSLSNESMVRIIHRIHGAMCGHSAEESDDCQGVVIPTSAAAAKALRSTAMEKFQGTF